jgi:hypothetical protein
LCSLAIEFRQPDVRKLLESIGNEGINRWKAWFDIYPFTHEREDLRTSLLAAVIHNMSGNAKKGADLDTYSFKWLGSKTASDTAFAAVKSWAMATKGGERG